MRNMKHDISFYFVFLSTTTTNIRQTWGNINVVLDEPYRYSCGRGAGTLATDGVTTGEGEVLTDTCEPGKLWIHIKLKYPTIVHEVIVWMADCGRCNSSSENVFDFFQVILMGPFMDSYNFSHNYPNKASLGTPMRLVLPVSHGLKAVSVKVQNYRQFTGQTVNISEIEVLEFNKTENIFYGCFKASKAISELRAPFDSCRWECATYQHLFYFFSSPAKCSCFSHHPEEPGPRENCITTCDTHPSGLCRNETEGYHAIYLARPAVPEYLGCFARYTLLNPMIEQTMTKRICMDHCTSKSLEYSILFDGDACYCTKDIIGKSKQTTTIGCSIPCAADNSLICGGKASFSIYRACWLPYPSYSCTYVGQCKDNVKDDTDICKNGCVEGWIGERCIRHELPESNITFVGRDVMTRKMHTRITAKEPPKNVTLRIFALIGLGLLVGVFLGLLQISIMSSD